MLDVTRAPSLGSVVNGAPFASTSTLPSAAAARNLCLSLLFRLTQATLHPSRIRFVSVDPLAGSAANPWRWPLFYRLILDGWKNVAQDMFFARIEVDLQTRRAHRAAGRERGMSYPRHHTVAAWKRARSSFDEQDRVGLARG